VFPLLGGLTHWFPKLTGRMLDERLGLLSCALVFIGFNVAFFPQHLLGLRGMPRRIYTYLPETGWGFWNLVSTIGAFTLGLGAIVFLFNAARSLRSGTRASDNPFHAHSLEWAMSSPPPNSSQRSIPVASSRYPLWMGELGRVIGLRPDEVLVTRAVDADPDHVVHAPQPTIMPVFTALATAAMIIACLFTPWGLPAGVAIISVMLFIWFWPTDREPAFSTRDRLRRANDAEGVR